MKARAMRVRARKAVQAAPRGFKSTSQRCHAALRRKVLHDWGRLQSEYERGMRKAFKSLMDAGPYLQRLFNRMVFRPAERHYCVGDYATRDGTDVQLVTRTSAHFADFKCIKAPRTGWIEVGEVEHNMMRRYSPLSADEARAMIEAHS